MGVVKLFRWVERNVGQEAAFQRLSLLHSADGYWRILWQIGWEWKEKLRLYCLFSNFHAHIDKQLSGPDIEEWRTQFVQVKYILAE